MSWVRSRTGIVPNCTAIVLKDKHAWTFCFDSIIHFPSCSHFLEGKSRNGSEKMIELPPDDAGMETAELFGTVVAEPVASDSSLLLPAAIEDDDGVLSTCERQVWPNIFRSFLLVRGK